MTRLGSEPTVAKGSRGTRRAPGRSAPADSYGRLAIFSPAALGCGGGWARANRCSRGRAPLCACGHVHAADGDYEDAGCRSCECITFRPSTVVFNAHYEAHRYLEDVETIGAANNGVTAHFARAVTIYDSAIDAVTGDLYLMGGGQSARKTLASIRETLERFERQMAEAGLR